MYCCKATRSDLAYAVHQHCRALSRLTPELVAELRVTFSYLNQHPSIGLTFEAGRKHELSGYSDSDWVIKNTTSGWIIFWQNAPLVWGSRKQNCVALSSCEAEIIALSEAAKDMVYLRKFISGLTGKQPGGPSILRARITRPRATFHIILNFTTGLNTWQGATSSFATWWRHSNSMYRLSAL